MFTDSYLPYTSGVVRSLQTFRQELTALGHRVFIFAPDYGTPREPDVFRYFALPAPTHRGYYLAVPLSLRTRGTIRRLQLDVIHVHSPFLLGRLGLVTGHRLGLPVVFTYHTLYDRYAHYAPVLGSSLRSLVGRVARDFCNRCDLVIAPTASVARLLESAGVRSPLRIVPTGVDLTEFAAADPSWAREELALTSRQRLLVTVGRLGREKNLVFLLEVLSHLGPEVRLAVVGDGPLRRQLEETADRLGVTGRVTFTGRLDRPRLGSVLAAAELFVFSSTSDTQGVVLLEAQATCLPVVAIDAPGACDMVSHGENGFLTPADPALFAGRVRELLDDDQRRRDFAARALVHAQRFSAPACARQLAAVYQEALGTTCGSATL